MAAGRSHWRRISSCCCKSHSCRRGGRVVLRRALLVSGCAPDSAVTFFCVRQKKVTKEKASRSQGRYAVPCAARFEGEARKLALRAQTSEPLVPLAPVLLSPARTAGKQKNRTTNSQTRTRRGASLWTWIRVRFWSLVSTAVMRRRVAQAWADQGARMSEAQPSLRAPRRSRATQRARSAAQGRRIRLAFLSVTLLWRSKER